MDVPQQETPGCTAEGSESLHIFQLANQEFEGNEWESESAGSSGDMLPKHPEPRMSEEASTSHGGLVEQPSGPSAEEVAAAVADMERFMAQFNVDLAAVTQAFLKTSGDATAVTHLLKDGPNAAGCPPLWTRQDDLDLMTGDACLRNSLIARYGEANVDRRLAFRKN